mmetsp:Transcript_16006/g.54369  ORF Transcript_16006/g.54369 Transcript_16006/m.54369 type:complete len:169 (-) Transcript_16006:2744-3250(-)
MENKLHYTRGYCPIPREQRLLSLFNKLNNNVFNRIITLQPIYLTIFTGFALLLCISISQTLLRISNFSNIHINDFTVILFFPIIILTNVIYLWLIKEWTSLKKKTQKAITVYEETGLLESQIWKKPVITLIQDTLIINYRLKPLLRKIIYQITTYNIVIFLLITAISI